MTKFILFILDKLQGFFKWLNVDYQSLRAIVEIKLITENRRAHGAQRNQAMKKERNNTFALSLIMPLIFSFLTGMIIFLPNQSVYIIMMISFAIIMFMVAFSMISDFAEVLFDTTDNVILLPRPVDSRVIWMARLIHIVVFLGAQTLANSLGFIIYASIKFGASAGFIFFICVILLCLVTIFLTAILYLLLIKVISQEKLKDVIGYIQILFSVSVAIGYQFVGQMYNFIGGSSEIVLKWWHFISPFAWFAGIMEAFIKRHLEVPYMIFLGLGLIIPALLLLLMNRYLAPLFAKGLSNFAMPDIVSVDKLHHKGNGLLTMLSKIFTKTRVEKAAFELVWLIASRDRKFKVRAYPTFGMLIYFIYNFLTNDKKSDIYLYITLYYGMFSVWIFTQQIYVSDEWKAGWVYRVSAIEKPGEVLLGGLKSVMISIGIPIFVILGFALGYKAGVAVVDDIIFASINTLLFLSFNVFGGMFSMPFSTEVAASGKPNKSQWIKFMILLIVAPVFGIIHYFIAKTTYGIIVLSPIFLLIALLLVAEYRKISWHKIKENGA